MRSDHVGLLTATLSLVLALPVWAQEQPLPVTRVVLFRSGVGYVERAGTVQGDASLTLSFKTEQINDLLKSLVLQDLDGGQVQPVSYAPRDPLARQLQSFAIDLSDNPDRAELLNRLRGVAVEVTLPTETFEARVVGVEEQPVYSPEGETVTVMRQLHLATGEGLRMVGLDQVQRLRILDERLQAEFESALATLASGLDNTRKTVQLAFAGEGERRVRVGYMVEMPVWKMSYRLVLGEGEAPFLQGWAIVENTSEEDWEGVAMALVSGRPISFIQDLYQPLYMPRPEVQPRLYASLQPRTYEGAVTLGQELAEMEAPPAERARRETLDRAARPAAPAEPAATAPGMGGYGGGGMMAGAAFEYAGTSVASMASAQELGALFEYRIDQPVSLARQRSALIPIVNQEVEGEPVSVYNPASHARFPLYGLKLKNSTDLTLMEGPLTVYAQGAYGGDALIEDIEPGGERLLTYALDLKMEVTPEQKEGSQSVVDLKIVRGVLVETRKVRAVLDYTARNRAQETRQLLVEHPVREGWQLVQPESFEEKTAQVYRFRMELPADDSMTLQVVEERQQDQQVALRDAPLDRIELYLRNPQASPALQAALQQVMAQQREIARLQGEINRRSARIEEIDSDQARIRENMARLDRTSELYQRYVRTLGEQEDELGRLRDEIEELQDQLNTQQQALQDYLSELSVE